MMLTMTVNVNKYGLVSIRVCCKWERSGREREEGRREWGKEKEGVEYALVANLHCVLLLI